MFWVVVTFVYSDTSKAIQPEMLKGTKGPVTLYPSADAAWRAAMKYRFDTGTYTGIMRVYLHPDTDTE